MEIITSDGVSVGFYGTMTRYFEVLESELEGETNPLGFLHLNRLGGAHWIAKRKSATALWDEISEGAKALATSRKAAE